MHSSLEFALAGLIVLVLGCAGCGKEDVIEREVAMHAPASCALSNDAYAVVRGYGDYEPEGSPSGFFLRDGRVPIASLNDETRDVVVQATLGEARWLGRAFVRNGIDVLLLRERATCALSQQVDAREGGALVRVGDSEALLTTGSASVVPRSFVIDLRTGKIAALEKDLLRSRMGASVTGTEEAAVVAGGVHTSTGEFLADVELFRNGSFDRSSLALSHARTEHDAVNLGDGRILVLGGRGSSGLLRSLEVVDANGGRVETAGLAQLDAARRFPLAARLSNGEVLVVGGVDSDAKDVLLAEWISRDGRSHARSSVPVLAKQGSALLANGEGGALLAARDGSEARLFAIGEDGTIGEAGQLLGVTHVSLFPDIGGNVLVHSGRAWFRYSAWARRLELLADLGADGPATNLAVSGESGLVLYLDATSVKALRVSAASAYAPLDGPLASSDVRGLVPVSSGFGAPRFSPETGVTLVEGERVAIADRRFADFELTFDASGALPEIVLRDEQGEDFAIGSAACPFRADRSAPRLVRRGRNIEGAANCELLLGHARVQIHLRGPAGGSSFRNLMVRRTNR